jgi:hypothetical protein
MNNPVAWIHRFIEGGISIGKKPVDLDRHPDRWMPVYADPTPCQTCEALARTVMMDQTSHDTPPQREWQGLTDEEIDELFDVIVYDLPHAIQVTRAIEAKLREKMETFEWLTLLGGVMIGMGVLLFMFAAAVAFFIGAADEPES